MSHNLIVTKEEMNLLDRLTIEEKGITKYQLMYEAGTRLFEYMRDYSLYSTDDKILIVAGLGKNGADALVIGNHLIDIGIAVKILVVGELENMCEETLEIYNVLKCKNINIMYLNNDDIENYSILVEESTIVVDGIIGTGVKHWITGYWRELIQEINRCYARVISIDIPSGINANNGLRLGECIDADITLVIQAYKQGNILNDAPDYHGKKYIVDCGILFSLFDEKQFLLSTEYLLNRIPKRRSNTYKYKFGDILVIGGSKGMMGAPVLSAYSALRSGSGLSSILFNDSNLRYFSNAYPEIMYDTMLGIEDLPKHIKGKSCVVFGPGLKVNDTMNLEILSYLLQTEVPLVIDATGLIYFKSLVQEYSTRENIIITPHYNELAKFLDVDLDDVKEESVLLCKNIAHKYNITVVLKGTCTVITNNSETYFSNNATPGLATAGSGDVLAGIIASILGKGNNPMDSAKIGVLVHSKAAKLAESEFGEESMIATDVIGKIPSILKESKIKKY